MVEFNQWHIEELTLDVDSNTQGSIPVIYGRQGDKDGILCNIELTQQGVPLQASWFDGKRVFYEARGNGVSVRKQADAIEGNVVKVVLPEAVFNQIGLVPENFLRVEDATTEELIISGTTAFRVYVRQGNLDPDASRYYLEEIENISNAFKKWFKQISNTIGKDVAAELAAKVTELENEKLEVTTYLQSELTTAQQLAKKPDKGNIKAQDLSVASDDDKVQLNNLSDEVRLAMAGNAPVSPIIPDRSITFEKIGYLEVERKNLANPAEFDVANTSVNPSTGATITYPGFQASGFIPIMGNSQYALSRTYNVAFYTADKVYISGLSGGTWSNPLTTPINAKFMRVTFGLNDTNKMVSKGSTLPPYVAYADYEVHIQNNELKQTVKKLAKEEIDTHEYKDKSVPLRALEAVQVGAENLANPAEFTANGFGVISTGEIVSLAGYFATGFIPVKAGLPYSLSQRNNIAWYDINKVLVAAKNGNTNYTNPQVAPAGAAFLRASFKTDHRSQAMVIQSDTLPAFIPFGSKQVSFVSEEWKLAIARALGVVPNRLSALIWNALGNSITFGLGATKPYHRWISERTGITVRNYGISMSTVCEMDDATNVQNGTHPASAYNPMCIRYADMDDNADVITVMAGNNDISHGAPLGTMNDRTTKTFFGGLHILLLGLIQKYPEKSIGFMLPPMGAPTDGDTGRTEEFIAAIKRVCKYYGIPVLDTYSGNQLSTRVNARGQVLMPDGTHPSDKGHEKLSFPVEQFLMQI